MTPSEFRDRTERFAVQVLKFSRPLADDKMAADIARQLRRSATSIAQNYSAATVARSRRDFTSKLRIALEEAEETARWLRMLRDADMCASATLGQLITESFELTKILSAACKTVARNNPMTQ